MKINKPEIEEWLSRINAEEPLYTVGINVIFDPYNYGDTIMDFVEYAKENNWLNPDYDSISRAWKKAKDKIVFISQLNQEDIFRIIAWHIRGDRFCSGLLASAFNDGYIQTALKRLLEI